MFFGAIARPSPGKGFDGRVLLMPVCTKKIMKRNSKYNSKGESRLEPTTMTKDLFREYVKKYLIPTIDHLGKKLGVKRIIVQMDQAGGHGGGKGNMTNILGEFNAIGSQISPPATFIIQPSKSPDFNALDLGIKFTSISSDNYFHFRSLVFFVCWSSSSEMPNLSWDTND